MKRRLVIFLCATLLSLLVIPVANIIAAPDTAAVKWREQSFLYNVDFASRVAAWLLYPLGISTDPAKVIIGRDDWLYLGDGLGQTLSVNQRPPTPAEVERGEQIGAATDAWDAYFSSKGVKLFRVMIGPDKGTIYPEHMPDWARPTSPNATDALFAGASKTLYVDLREPLLQAKANQGTELYYKTDSHWNSLGAGIAFRAFAQQVGAAAPDLRWPSDSVYRLRDTFPRTGGDLANMLRLSAALSDIDPLNRVRDLPVETVQSDFDTKQVIRHGGNPVIWSVSKPLLVKSRGALNDKKVLWLRDSFGGVMAPFMAATFSDVLQFYSSEAIKPGGRLFQLVEDWKPDYVFFTVVERGSRAIEFTAFPPPAVLPRRGEFEEVRTATPFATWDLAYDRSKNEYQVKGGDPNIDFALSDAINSADARYLSIDLSCGDGATLVPIQVFWLGNKQSYYDEAHSVHLQFPAGRNLLDLHTLPRWKSAGTIRRLRFDIDLPNVCANFKLANLSVGRYPAGANALH